MIFTTPSTTSEASATATRAPVGYASATSALTGSIIRSWVRDPIMLIQTIIFPILLLVLFHLVFGSTMSRMGGENSIGGTTALLILVSTMQGSIVANMRLINARDGGLLDRWWSLPMAHATILLARLVAVFLYAMVVTLLLIVVGMVLGLRFEGSFLEVLASLLAAMILAGFFGAACSALVLLLSIRGSEKSAVTTFSGIFMLLMFFNTGFAPADAYPWWIRWFIRHQPMSPTIESMRAFFAGQPDGGATLEFCCWTAAILLVCGAGAYRAMKSTIGSR